MVIFVCTDKYLNDTFEFRFETATWTELSTRIKKGAAPPAAYLHGVQAINSKLYIFTGSE